uniref:T-cell surface antigen CD2-like n=1 Tax=Scatophagus argus TaxID=75038 RepID=UPI001ED817F9|nr:T-cell surface antigen CD2-like [Scatophagus argus]
MICIYMIFTALGTAASAKGSTECNFSELTAAQCFGAEGQMLTFHLQHSNTYQITLKKDHNSPIARAKNHTWTLYGEHVNQSELFTNGTLKLGKAMKRHSGDYLLEVYDSDGVWVKNVIKHLEIQAPVSKPAVSQTCLSPEQMIISCSSEGDEVEFTLTLDGLLLVQTRNHSQSQTNWTANMKPLAGSAAEHKASSSNVTISLHGQVTGSLKCHVGNKVSRDETVIHLTSCEGSISHLSLLAVAVIVSVVTLLLHAALFLCIKHLNNKTRPTTASEALSDNPEDKIIYSDVRVKKKTKPTQLDPNLTVCFYH